MWRDRCGGVISKKWLGSWVEEAAEEETETRKDGATTTHKGTMKDSGTTRNLGLIDSFFFTGSFITIIDFFNSTSCASGDCPNWFSLYPDCDIISVCLFVCSVGWS